MAFTKDLTTYESAAVMADAPPRMMCQYRKVDFSVTANNLIQNAIMALFKIPADVLVFEVLMKVLTADTDVTDVDVGDFDSTGTAITAADSFIDGATLASTGWKRDNAGESFSIQDGTTNTGFIHTADWIIGLTNKDADTLNGAIVEFWVYGWDMR